MKARRQAGSHRGSMGAAAHDRARRTRGVTETAHTPVTIRDNSKDGSFVAADFRDHLGRQLGKYARRITRVALMTHDESGPTAATRIRATLQLTTRQYGVIPIGATGTTARAASSAAVRSAERAMRRRVERARA